MQASQIPTKFNLVWGASAGAGFIRAIPAASQIGVQNGAASLTDGFPPLTFQSVAAGGIPPFGQDMNGILNQITAWEQWHAAGGPITYDATFQSAIGGYPKGSIVQSATTAGTFWRATTDNNTTNPDASGAGWAAWNFVPAVGGNAATATTLQTPRTISATGDVSWSTTFNGSANVTGGATIQPGAVTAAKMAAGAAVSNIGFVPLAAASNLADLTNIPGARANIGLGTLATSNGLTLVIVQITTPGPFSISIPANALPTGLGFATGAGGGAAFSGSGKCGGGGGAGGTAMGPVTLTPGGTITGTVGSGGGGGSGGSPDASGGGATTLGPLTGNGGVGGQFSSAVAGGNGGGASGGAVNLEGGYGVDGSTTTNVTPWACGGGSYWGGGLRAANTNAVSGGAPGAGAGVAYAVNGGIGGTGVNGIAVLWYWTH